MGESSEQKFNHITYGCPGNGISQQFFWSDDTDGARSVIAGSSMTRNGMEKGDNGENQDHPKLRERPKAAIQTWNRA
jgi:hypothetical protein